MRYPEHAFRRALRARTRVRPSCLIQTAPFCDWLKSANQPVVDCSTSAATRRPKESRRRDAGAPGISGLAQVSANHANVPPATTDSLLNLLRTGEPLPTPCDLGVEMSHLEFAVFNGLGKEYPEAYDWIIRKAMERDEHQDLLALLERQDDL